MIPALFRSLVIVLVFVSGIITGVLLYQQRKTRPEKSIFTVRVSRSGDTIEIKKDSLMVVVRNFGN